jgi:tRNA threonylcarbamoyladenosine biosynthesis protein TsaB
MRILAVDTSTDYLSVAVCAAGEVRAEATILAERRHAERIVDVIDRTLSDAALRLPELDLLAVTVGPGSFTGLRIGVSTLKGLADGANLPLAGVSTLDAMTRQVDWSDGLFCPLLDARMGEVYGAIYQFADGKRETVRPARVGPVEALLQDVTEPITVFGEGARNYADRIAQSCPLHRALPGLLSHPRGAAVAAEALAAVEAGANTDAALVRPIYLRQSQPEEARRRAQEAATA